MPDALEARRLLAGGRAQASAVQTPADAEAPAATLTVGNAPCTYATISAAVVAANPGDLLLIQGGATFNEKVSIDKNLILEGGYTGCTGGTTAPATIDAGGSGRGVYVTGSKVTLRNLQITGGDATTGGGVYATNGAVIILESAEVTANTAYFGGGIFVDSGTEVALTQRSTVHDNTAKIAGGGVRVRGRLIATDTYSRIRDNTAPHGGGASVFGGVLHLIEADMTGNRATDPAGMGGAILLQQGAVVTTTGNVWITGANQAVDGAGIYADSSKVFLEYAVFSDNVATGRGGGLFLTNGSTLSATFAFIGYPTGSNRARDGAGIYVDGSTVTFGGKIQNNIASNFGAGLYAINSTLAMVGAQVGGTDYNQANQLGPDGHRGVGLYLDATHATLLDTSIVGNIFQTTGLAFGGGAYVAGGSILTLTNSTIESHVAPSAFDGRGAGLYVQNATATLDNSDVLSNTAGTLGGGVRLYGTSTLNILNGSELRNNRALDGPGGAVAAGEMPDLNISDAVLRENSAATDGGAIYLNAGTLDFTGGWTLRHNTAGGNGGAVAVAGTATASFNAGGYSLAYDNVAEGGHGGMVYLGNATTMKLHAISGHELYVYANRIDGNGGALYADGGGLFDIYGQVRFDSNRADNGGAIYLSDYSAIWLDDHGDAHPELWDNRAYPGSGGAIYALRSPYVECDGATFGRVGEGNQASKLGGAIYMDGSILDADNCIFQDNRAGEDGGAIAAVNARTRIHATYPSVALAAERTDALHALDAEAISATACDPRSQLCSVFSGNVVADSEGEHTWATVVRSSTSTAR
jgi:predicted outer membrane repeat protein